MTTTLTEKLAQLEKLVEQVYKAEKTRLIAERDFLKKVLASSYGSAQPTKDAQVQQVLADVAKVCDIK